ncbi:hypothetical protein [Bradyrhizobium sp. 930_D9_N1_4]|uniref:hypothetical protein n=1 Tax=Bradyrhizobium sp. 930_D9_N1_4 TaxID=3240374 RepID=UPI003F8AEF71
MTERLGDAPIQQEYRELMNAVARGLDQAFNGDATGAERGTGFVLLVFPFGHADGSRCNFISNGADRKDVVSLMKEMIARFEGQPEVSGRA